MNILFLTLSKFTSLDERNIYVDLVKELGSRGYKVYIVSPRQKREKLPTELIDEGNIQILHVKTGNITKTKSFIEKGISTILLESQYRKAINKYFSNITFDMVIYSTPPITFNKIIKYYKKSQNSKTYLMLKDIFPQNAVDIEAMKKGSFIWKYFRDKEIELYKLSDTIGAMSSENVNYVLSHNRYIDTNKLEVFPNAVKPISRPKRTTKDKILLEKYGIPVDATLFIYGGNLGKPQGIDFLLQVIEEFYKVTNAYLLIVGDGTEYDRIENFVRMKERKNVSILKRLPKVEYDKLMSNIDVGLIFLDERFTIPNFPSRITSYMENAVPVLAATDVNTDVKNVLINSNSGFWCRSGDLKTFISKAKILTNDRKLREKMGINGRIYLEENYDITQTVDILIKHL
ncbi:glycosyltransferase family 4 protein [Tetragenococcus koreensis]|uniref:glycosyltransferase family 4 protein n=1 Tax=Tetragenococcus koreensis TaxID=290335 RepID=UPI001F2B8AEC|nr:glycosyltransferase family 4 protein [Tetragenococcus koreensis]MCF1613596.1 glycosyltransferase family 4 protein [Tetragenococcus koreensis]MCF1623408.1 glycosyltransferase family 4 protein [Tetragenococcus koreensis]